jgi:hypothetical protein
MKYKKILATVGSVLMLGATMAGAFAASMPTGLNAGNTVIVMGSGTGVSDDLAKSTILNPLAETADGTDAPMSVDGGDEFKLEKSSDMFYFNETLDSSYTSLGDDELTEGLAEGTYDSGDVDVDYEQSITLGSKALDLFADKDYDNDEPAVGFWFTNDDTVLSYTIDFDDDELNVSLMPETDMPFLGKNYYVLTATQDKIELLDSANSVLLEDGAETTVNGKTISINWIDDDEVILNVDGTDTDKLNEGDIDELSDGSYVAIKNILASSRESTTQKVEFSIGSGKIILEDGKDVIMGEDSDDEIDNLVARITDGSDTDYINGITLEWKSN